MQYSPLCAIPYVAMVDAGTVELVRTLGVEVLSSAELVQHFEARWNQAALDSHLEAGRRVGRVRAAAFRMITEGTRNGGAVQEIEGKQVEVDGLAAEKLITDHEPVLALNPNASTPHYEPRWWPT